MRAWLKQYRTLWTTLEPGVISPGAVLAVRTLHSLHPLLYLGVVLDGQEVRPVYTRRKRWRQFRRH